MNILDTTEVKKNGKLVNIKRVVSFPDRLGRLELQAYLVEQGTGAGEFRFQCKLPGFLHTSFETFPSFSAALERGASVGKERMEEVNFALKIPAKTAEQMKFVSIWEQVG